MRAIRVVSSRIGFGLGSLHHLFSANSRLNLLNAALDEGITHFDTSPYYGYGLGEQDLGRLLATHRPRVTVTTKVGLYAWWRSDTSAWQVWGRKSAGKFVRRLTAPVVSWDIGRARRSLRESLRRLRTDYVDLLMLHEPEMTAIDHDAMVEWLEAEKASGLICGWGIAGEPARVSRFVATSSPLASVVQTRDSLVRHEAGFLIDAGRQLQFTYGYFSQRESRAAHALSSAAEAMRRAMQRNTTGCVLFSTRRIEHLRQMARAVISS